MEGKMWLMWGVYNLNQISKFTFKHFFVLRFMKSEVYSDTLITEQSLINIAFLTVFDVMAADLMD